MGQCVFDLSESGRSLTALEGLGPSTQKTKTERRRRDFVAKTLQNVRVSMHSGHPSNSATIPSLHRPTRPTRPVDHPTGRPAHHLPPLGPTLGTRPDGPLSPGPLGPPLFFVFCFRGSLAGSLGAGRPLSERLKTHRLEEELIQLGDASGQVGEALQVGEQQEARREWLLGRGGASGAAAVPGLAHSCGCVGRFVWCVLSYHTMT